MWVPYLDGHHPDRASPVAAGRVRIIMPVTSRNSAECFTRLAAGRQGQALRCRVHGSGRTRGEQGAERVERGVDVEVGVEQHAQQQPVADRAEQRGDRVGGDSGDDRGRPLARSPFQARCRGTFRAAGGRQGTGPVTLARGLPELAQRAGEYRALGPRKLTQDPCQLPLPPGRDPADQILAR